tara:strand:+ start:8218 stop:8610 length:393 start_codon:yes stop_codon:yes gene_type:complete
LAQERPLMTDLTKGQAAPWNGRLFNSAAIAKMVVENELALEHCRNETDRVFKKEEARCEFLLENARIIAETRQRQFDAILEIKDGEIDKLHEIIKNSDNSDNYIWWFVGGAVIGIVTSITIFYAAVETAK